MAARYIIAETDNVENLLIIVSPRLAHMISYATKSCVWADFRCDDLLRISQVMGITRIGIVLNFNSPCNFNYMSGFFFSYRNLLS